MAGLPGTGKSTLARALADHTHGAILSKDEVRAALFSPNNLEYSLKQDDFVMDVMLDTARYLLQCDPARKSFFDGRTFSRRYQIDRVLKFAAELNQPWAILECVCSDESAKHRLDRDLDTSHLAANRNFALYLEVKNRFEPIIYPKTVIDTDRELDDCVEQATAAITK
jgi:predicted kinase